MMLIGVLAGAAAVGLVAWAFGDKIEEENEKYAATRREPPNMTVSDG